MTDLSQIMNDSLVIAGKVDDNVEAGFDDLSLSLRTHELASETSLTPLYSSIAEPSENSDGTEQVQVTQKQARECPVENEGETPVKILKLSKVQGSGSVSFTEKNSDAGVAVMQKYPTNNSRHEVSNGNQGKCKKNQSGSIFVNADSIKNLRHQQYYNVQHVTPINLPTHLIDAMPSMKTVQASSDKGNPGCNSNDIETLNETCQAATFNGNDSIKHKNQQGSGIPFTGCNSSTHLLEPQMQIVEQVDTGDHYQAVNPESTYHDMKSVVYLDHGPCMPEEQREEEKEEYSGRNIDSNEYSIEMGCVDGSHNCSNESATISNNFDQFGDQGHILKTSETTTVTISTEQISDNQDYYVASKNKNEDGVITVETQEIQNPETSVLISNTATPCQQESVMVVSSAADVPSTQSTVTALPTPQTTISDIWKLQVTPEAKPLISQATKDLVTKWATANVTPYTGTPHPTLTGKYMVPMVQTNEKQTKSASGAKTQRQPTAQLYLQYTAAGGPSQSSSFQSETGLPISNLSLNSTGSEERMTSPDDDEPPSSISGAVYTAVTSPIGVFTTSTPVMPSATQLNAALFRVRNDSICETEYDAGRHAHNAKERARRARIKIACEKLRDVVPGITLKTDKATVFEFAVEYLAFLKRLVGPQFDKEFLKQCSPY